MSMVFTGTIANSLKLTLRSVVDDDLGGSERKAIAPKWCWFRSMTDNWEDDLEMGGPGLASEKAEGAEISTGTIQEGFMTRYRARTFGLKLVIVEEAIEDKKYPQVLSGGRRLSRAMWKTIDIDATSMLARAWNSNFIGGDGQPLASDAHTLPNGGTFSNMMGTPMAPSRIALISAITQIRLLPGHDGITEGYEAEQVLCPESQWAVWKGILGSTHAPEPGQYNEINVVHGILSKGVQPIKYWLDTATRWMVKTDAENGLQFRFKRRPRQANWTDNDNTVMKHSVTARWSRGWSNARTVLTVDA